MNTAEEVSTVKADLGHRRLVDRVAANVQRRRLELDLSQTRVAELADFPTANYGRLERGDGNPTLRTLAAIASALAMDPADLFSPNGDDLLATFRQFVERQERDHLAHPKHVDAFHAALAALEDILAGRMPSVSDSATSQRI